MDEHFKNMFEIKDSQVNIDHNDKALQKQLLMMVNDNVYKNLNNFSILLFDDNNKHHKQEFSTKHKEKLVNKLIENE